MFRSVNFPGWGKSNPTPPASSSSPQPKPPTSSSSSQAQARAQAQAQAQQANPNPSSSSNQTNVRKPPGSKDQPLGRSFLLGGPRSSAAAGAVGASSPLHGSRPQIGGKGVIGRSTGGKVGIGGKGLGLGAGLGKGKGGFKRHRYVGFMILGCGEGRESWTFPGDTG